MQEIIIFIIFMKPVTSLSFFLSFSFFLFSGGDGVCVCVCVCVCWGGGGTIKLNNCFPMDDD